MVVLAVAVLYSSLVLWVILRKKKRENGNLIVMAIPWWIGAILLGGMMGLMGEAVGVPRVTVSEERVDLAPTEGAYVFDAGRDRIRYIESEGLKSEQVGEDRARVYKDSEDGYLVVKKSVARADWYNFSDFNKRTEYEFHIPEDGAVGYIKIENNR